MDSSAASAFIYAKASGMLAKSFVGERASKLFSVKSLRELYSLLFSDEVPSIPEILLSKEIERKAENLFLEEFIDLIKIYSKPEKILLRLLSFYDYDNLKEIGAALSLGETEFPEISHIKSFSILNYKAWPNIQKITDGSEISWYNRIPLISEQQLFDSKLDSQYISELWKAAQELSGDDRYDVSKLIKSEISSRNILWVLRLKVYYKMKSSEIKEKLAYAEKSKSKNDELAKEALSILEKDVGNFDDWKDWKYKSYLNPNVDGSVWEADPVWIEKSFKREINKMALRSFHKNPMSVLSMVSWFKIKQNELDNIRTVSEGLRLDLGADKLMDTAGITAVSD